MDGNEGGRESKGGGGDRSVSVKERAPKQMSTSQSDRQNTLTMVAGVTGTFIRHSELKLKTKTV